MIAIPQITAKGNFLFFGIKSCQPFHLNQLSRDDLTAHLFKSEEFQSSDLYMICKVKRIRIVLSSSFLIYGILWLTLRIAGSTRLFKIKLYKSFGTRKLKIDKKSSSEKEICIIVVNRMFFVKAEDLEKVFNLGIINPPRILYIGESQKMEKRAIDHEKIGQCLSHVDDDEELKFLFVTLNYELGYSQNNVFCYVPLNIQDHLYIPEMDFSAFNRSKVQVAERLLINFYLPVVNRQFKGDNMHKNDILNKVKRGLNIDFILFGTAMIDKSFQFETESQRINYPDFVFNFGYGNDGYEKLLLDAWINSYLKSIAS